MTRLRLTNFSLKCSINDRFDLSNVDEQFCSIMNWSTILIFGVDHLSGLTIFHSPYPHICSAVFSRRLMLRNSSAGCVCQSFNHDWTNLASIILSFHCSLAIKRTPWNTWSHLLNLLFCIVFDLCVHQSKFVWIVSMRWRFSSRRFVSELHMNEC